MLTHRQLRRLIEQRLKDTEALLAARRYSSAIYFVGYAIELALKARICKVLNWKGFPESRSEFESLQSFRTHDLKRLLQLSGLEALIRRRYSDEWSKVEQWSPEKRYDTTSGRVTKAEALLMVAPAKILLSVISGS